MAKNLSLESDSTPLIISNTKLEAIILKDVREVGFCT